MYLERHKAEVLGVRKIVAVLQQFQQEQLVLGDAAHQVALAVHGHILQDDLHFAAVVLQIVVDDDHIAAVEHLLAGAAARDLLAAIEYPGPAGAQHVFAAVRGDAVHRVLQNDLLLGGVQAGNQLYI